MHPLCNRRPQEARREAEADTLRELDDVEQSFAVERVAFLERADKAAADAAERDKIINDLRNVEVTLKGQLEKIRREMNDSLHSNPTARREGLLNFERFSRAHGCTDVNDHVHS